MCHYKLVKFNKKNIFENSVKKILLCTKQESIKPKRK